MQEHTRKHPIKNDRDTLYIHDGIKTYAIPTSVANKYLVTDSDKQKISSHELFESLDRERTQAGALLRGLRSRENMSQTEFSKIIDVTQANLSKMENGKRPIGKQVAKRISASFDVNYKYFLE